MVAYEQLTKDRTQNDVHYIEMRFEAKTAALHTVECGAQEFELAPLRARAISAAIDGFILAVVTLVFSALLGTAGLVLSLLFVFVFQWYFLSERFGQTPGKMVMNIFVIRADGEFPTARDAVMRTIGSLVNTLALGLGWLWVIGDKRQQGWHDKLAKTYVVKS